MLKLQVKNLVKNFGGLKAVDNLSFDVEKGDILGLIGPNGAGKTTVFNLITGFLKIDSGKVLFNKRDIANLGPYEINKIGISRTFQIVRIFPKLTVAENVYAGLIGGTKSGCLRVLLRSLISKGNIHKNIDQKRSNELLKFVGLLSQKNELAENLPYALCKRLELARALATKPELILLDEPSGGLNTKELEDQILLIKRIYEMGITIVIVEHLMKVIMSICNRIIVVHYGEKIAEGSPEEVSKDKKVTEAYLGSSLIAKNR